MNNKILEMMKRLAGGTRQEPYKKIELAVMDFKDIFAVDSAWLLYPCDPQSSRCTIRFSSTRPDYPHTFANQDVLPVTGGIKHLFKELLATDQPVVYVEGNPNHYFQPIAARYGIKSQLAKIMRMRNQPPWVLGLHQSSSVRHWSDEEILLFHCTVDRLTDAFDADILHETIRNDIAKRQKVDAALAVSEQRFRTLFHHANTSWCLCDYSSLKRYLRHQQRDIHGAAPEFSPSDCDTILAQAARLIKIVDVNQGLLDLFGMASIHEFAGKWQRIVTPSTTHDVLKKMLGAIYTGQPHFTAEAQFQTLSGKPLAATVTMELLPGEQAGLVLVSLITHEASGDAERRLLESREKYRLLVETANDAIIVADVESGIILEANRKAGELLGRPVERLIGMDQAQLIPPHDRERHGNNLFQVPAGNHQAQGRHEISILRADGYCIPVEISVNYSTLNDRSIVQGIFHDISERLELEARQRLLATAVEQADESVVITDLEGNIEYVNPTFERVTGYEFKEVAGRNPRLLKSGKMDDSYYSLLWHELSKGQVWRGRFINKKKDGAIFEEEAAITPVRDKQGRVQHYVAVKRDITQQVIWENQVRQSQKMQAIGVLAGGIAHDFNNILTAIMGFAEMSLMQAEDDELLAGNLIEIVKAAHRAGKLIDQILTFSRQTEKNIGSLEVRTIVKEVLKLLRASLPANIKIIQEIDSDIMVRADPTQVHQIIMNLCTNAYQALGPQGGWIRVSLQGVEIEKYEGIELGQLSQGQYARLRIEDNGRGIPPEFIDRIFDPYFTTREKDEGNGLGLSVVHGIVNDHGGAVVVKSTPGKGSIFDVYLPRIVDGAKTHHPEEKRELLEGEGNILIVDDESQIVEYEMNVLEQLGYRTRCCGSSAEALEVFRRSPTDFDLVITDMAMPDLTGLDLFKKLRELNPKMPVIICTGYSAHISAESSQEMGLNGYLAKPFTADQLAREVKRIIDDKEID